MKPRNRSLRSLAPLLGTLAFFAAFVFFPVAAASKEYWKGRPDFTVGEAKGYFIWQDDDGWHVRWTTKGKAVVFAGTITCNGDFTDFQAVKKNKGDVIRKESQNTLRFDTRTEGGADGLDFRLGPSTKTITFDLSMGGAKVPVDHVKIGKTKQHPDKVPFTIDRGAAAAPPPVGKK